MRLPPDLLVQAEQMLQEIQGHVGGHIGVEGMVAYRRPTPHGQIRIVLAVVRNEIIVADVNVEVSG